ncbi:MAG: thioredoxin 1 [Patescibacteria group bacterium]|nr:thioredoxin 1 [Patescibacteria group bacterium]
MANLKIVSDASFEADVATGVTLVDFWAEWCGPCRMMLPRLEELAVKMNGKAVVAKMNVDENPITPSGFRIMSIPTMILFKDGKPVEKIVGVQEIAALETMISRHL